MYRYIDTIVKKNKKQENEQPDNTVSFQVFLLYNSNK